MREYSFDLHVPEEITAIKVNGLYVRVKAFEVGPNKVSIELTLTGADCLMITNIRELGNQAEQAAIQYFTDKKAA